MYRFSRALLFINPSGIFPDHFIFVSALLLNIFGIGTLWSFWSVINIETLSLVVFASRNLHSILPHACWGYCLSTSRACIQFLFDILLSRLWTFHVLERRHSVSTFSSLEIMNAYHRKQPIRSSGRWFPRTAFSLSVKTRAPVWGMRNTDMHEEASKRNERPNKSHKASRETFHKWDDERWRVKWHAFFQSFQCRPKPCAEMMVPP